MTHSFHGTEGEPPGLILEASMVDDARLILDQTGAHRGLSQILRVLDVINGLGLPRGDVAFHNVRQDPAEMRQGLIFGARLALGGFYGQRAADASANVLNTIGTE